MDATIREKLEKVKRLMENAATVGEAEAAAAAMQRLILKHNLSVEEVASLDSTQAREEYAADYFKVGDRKTQGLQWRINLIYMLSEYHFCAFIRYGHHGGEGIIVGQQTNKDAVRMMFDVTAAAIERIADTEWYVTRNNYQEWYRAGCPTATAWKNSFKIGFVAGLRAKMRAERQFQALEAPKTTALVSMKEVELKEAIDEKVGKVGNHRGSAPTNAAGYSRGVEKGRTHELSERLG